MLRIEDQGDLISITLPRSEIFLMQALMMEALETGDVRDFQTRVGATKERVRALLADFPDLPL